MEVNRLKLVKAGAILLAFIAVAVVVSVVKPAPNRNMTPQTPVLQVDTLVVDPQAYQFSINSFGTVQPRTKSLLVSQISGQITEVNPAFRDGGFFNKDDVLIQIDDRDYRSAVKVSQAELLRAQLALEEELALARQAERDWVRLGDGEKAPDLVLRKPQLAAAEATVLSARANLEKAELNLQRTSVTAPYDGRILSTNVDLGQFVNSNASLAEVFSTDVVEIRLPLKDSDLAYIQLPENYRGQQVPPDEFPRVTITSELGQPQQWEGRIVRAEAALDSNSHQLYVVAQILDPFAIQNSDKAPLKIGQYVRAQIDGLEVGEALVIPTSSLYQGTYIYVVENGVLRRQDIDVAFQTPAELVVADGLEPGAEVVVSPLGQVASGTRVTSNNSPEPPPAVANAKGEEQ